MTLASIILDAIRPHALEMLIGPVLAIYTGALVLYSAEKEFERWKFYFIGRHPGEIYVALWTVLVFGLLVWSFVTNDGYKMEPEIISTYIVVLGVLAITKKSKSMFKEIKSERVKQTGL
ncbi:hypothetical protein KW800_03225 [Candidatus Parcubacteria bacterium]|nr:hypothetical protein [Candidatus Parcubacteria bacterium]